jgi:hypothetical protein
VSAHAPGKVGCEFCAYNFYVAHGDVAGVARIAAQLGEVEGHSGKSSGGASTTVTPAALAASKPQLVAKLVEMGFSSAMAERALTSTVGTVNDRTLDFLLQHMDAPPPKSSCAVA